jgi:hypothetical protein
MPTPSPSLFGMPILHHACLACLPLHPAYSTCLAFTKPARHTYPFTQPALQSWPAWHDYPFTQPVGHAWPSPSLLVMSGLHQVCLACLPFHPACWAYLAPQLPYHVSKELRPASLSRIPEVSPSMSCILSLHHNIHPACRIPGPLPSLPGPSHSLHCIPGPRLKRKRCEIPAALCTFLSYHIWPFTCPPACPV